MRTSPVPLRRFPYLGIVSILIGFISLGIGIYSGYFLPEGQREPQLAIIKGPDLVFDPSATQSLDVVSKLRLGGIWGDRFTRGSGNKIWAVTFAIWNGGKTTIEPADILSDTLRIKVGSADQAPATIWELRILNSSRKEVHFETVEDSIETIEDVPYIPLDFAILETNDGAKISIVYSGPRNVPISLAGTVKGRKGVAEFSHDQRLIVGRFILIVCSFTISISFTILLAVATLFPKWLHPLLWPGTELYILTFDWIRFMLIFGPMWLLLSLAFALSIDFHALIPVPDFKA